MAHACNPSTLVGQITRSGVQDQPDKHGETPSLLKIQEAEIAVSQDRTIALWPGQQERNSVLKTKNKTKKQEKCHYVVKRCEEEKSVYHIYHTDPL